MNIVVTSGNKNLRINFGQKLGLAPDSGLNENRKFYLVIVSKQSIASGKELFILECPVKDGNPVVRLSNGEEISLFYRHRGRTDQKIRVKLV